MIIIADKTQQTSRADTVEIWTYSMKLKMKIENATVTVSDSYYTITSNSGEFIAAFPKNETAYISKTPETTQQIHQIISE